MSSPDPHTQTSPGPNPPGVIPTPVTQAVVGGQAVSEVEAPPCAPTPPALPSRAAHPARPDPMQPVLLALGQPLPPDPAAPDPTTIGSRPLPVTDTGSVFIQQPEPDEQEQAAQSTWVAVRSAPPWLVSLMLHTALLLVLALWFIQNTVEPIHEIEAVSSEDIGEQLLDDVLDFGDNQLEVDEALLTPKDLMPVDDPLAAPPNIDVQLLATSSSSTMVAPAIGLALHGREKGMKNALLSAYGGDGTTEAAVALGLAWLARNQRRDGSWSLSGPYSNGSTTENKPAATAMALLAFQGAGHTPTSGAYKQIVGKGVNALLKMQDKSGNFTDDKTPHHQRLYAQAQATIAVCELYGMTEDSKYRQPAQRAIDYAVKIQDLAGGWRYAPADDSDTSVTGWFVMALQSGMMAKLEVPSTTLARISGYLDKAAVDGGSQYTYRPGGPANPAMTAEGLLSRQYLGWRQDDARLVRGVTFLGEHPIRWDDQNVYYWYYATQVMHHNEGDAWERWNDVMKDVVPKHQIKEGRERGSWPPHNDEWGVRGGGRLFTTCLPIYMLEVYYRHLPIYSDLYESGAQF